MAALIFSYSIEISQLYQAPWINAVRNTKIGALALGHGFLWSDLICYTVGIALGVLLEVIFQRSGATRRKLPPNSNYRRPNEKSRH